jgi:hypothetical protein
MFNNFFRFNYKRFDNIFGNEMVSLNLFTAKGFFLFDPISLDYKNPEMKYCFRSRVFTKIKKKLYSFNGLSSNLSSKYFF